MPAAVVAALVMGNAVPPLALWIWVAAMFAAWIGLLLSVRGRRPGRARRGTEAPSLARRLRRHLLFAMLFGSLWGGGAFCFGADLTQGQMIFLSFLVTGCVSACCSALGPYPPAFYGYMLPAMIPLAYVNFMRSETEAMGIAALVLLYVPTVAATMRAYNRGILAALRLQAKNELLTEDLAAANAATAAATKSKWETLAHLSHELGTPMNAVLGFSEAMRKQLFGPLSQRYVDYAGHIHDSGRHALDLVHAILEASRAESGALSLLQTEIEPGSLITECMHMITPAALAKRLTLDARIEPRLPHLEADAPKLRQVLLNVLSNAVKYTPDGGRVTVEAHFVGDGLDIVVTDTGIGIAAADLDRCVKPFVRLNNPMTANVDGTGLGLSIAKRLVEAHGGRLGIASVPGKGTAVTMHLPVRHRLAA